MQIDSQKRTLLKAVLWRIIAIITSYLVLSINLNDNLKTAILLNMITFCLYYVFERFFNKVKWGKEQK
jgi:uncharacterized membrane protein (GlpM family)